MTTKKGKETVKDSRINILLIEHDFLTTLVFEQYAKKLGCQVVGIADNGADALRHANRLNPEVIIISNQLKEGTDSVEVAERIRESHNIPIVIVFEEGEHIAKERIRQIPFATYLGNPVTRQDLGEALTLLFQEQMKVKSGSREIESKHATSEVEVPAGSNNSSIYSGRW